MQVCKASHSCICVELAGLGSLQFYPADVASNTLELGSVFFSPLARILWLFLEIHDGRPKKGKEKVP